MTTHRQLQILSFRGQRLVGQRLVGFCFIGGAALACGGSGTPEGTSLRSNAELGGVSGDVSGGVSGDVSGEAPPGSGVAGGTTGDFTGDTVSCTPRRIEPGDGPQLSLSELLASDTGDFSVPIRWESRCAEPVLAGATGCDDAGAGFRALHGTATTVRISMLYDGSPGTTTYETPAEAGCAPERAMPYTVRLTSLDGVLDETFSALTAFCGQGTGLGLVRPVREFAGAIGGAAMGFSDDFRVEVTAGFFDDRMWFDLHVVPMDEPGRSVFTIDLPPYGVQTHDVPTASVLPSAPLAPGHCGPSRAP